MHIRTDAAFAVLLLIACMGPARADLSPAQKEQILFHFRESRSIPPDVELRVTRTGPSAVPSFQAVTITAEHEGRAQTFQVNLAPDGRRYFVGEPQDLESDPDADNRRRIGLKNAPSRGSPGAPVTIVEYSDFQCPYCRRADGMLDEVMKRFNGKVRRVYKHFPLKGIHPWAEPAARAAACAGRQDPEAFWRMARSIYDEQRSIETENFREKMSAFAVRAGLDRAEFDACLDSSATAGGVKSDMDEAAALGIHSTPTLFVNGHKVAGAADVESFAALIQEFIDGRHPGGSKK